ncbi:MAG: hypothetical protein NT159_05865 [Proteobacteria bacterium]|nr:hypothetical protein [Pseudomonadota bacterium]
MNASTKEEAYENALCIANNNFFDLRAMALAAAELIVSDAADKENATARVMRGLARRAVEMANAADPVAVAHTVA